MFGILLSDYFLIRRQNFHINDLYTANRSSAYWYILGLNWRAFLAWSIALWPLLRKQRSHALYPEPTLDVS